MTRPIPWLERRFEPHVDVSLAPQLRARLRGTPARLEELLRSAPSEVRRGRRPGGGWSVQEHAGHLGDLEPLWLARVGDLMGGAAELTPWEVTNAATEAAGHDDAPPEDLLRRFRSARGELLSRIEPLSPADLERTALHPRLRVRQRLVDVLAFVAEHDDHHLACMHALCGEPAAG